MSHESIISALISSVLRCASPGWEAPQAWHVSRHSRMHPAHVLGPHAFAHDAPPSRSPINKQQRDTECGIRSPLHPSASWSVSPPVHALPAASWCEWQHRRALRSGAAQPASATPPPCRAAGCCTEPAPSPHMPPSGLRPAAPPHASHRRRAPQAAGCACSTGVVCMSQEALERQQTQSLRPALSHLLIRWER